MPRASLAPAHLALVLLLVPLPRPVLAHKPAQLPLLGRKPFIAAWNAPLDMCTVKYNISANLALFHVQGSPRAARTGQNVTIFYANRLGRYPFYTEEGTPVNGGLPQNCSLESHLHKARHDIGHYIPATDFRGLAVIDWEYWRPQWSRNWHKKDIYRQKSRELARDALTNATAEQVENVARGRFEGSAMAFMRETLRLGTQARPRALWGYYLYPDCHNYNVQEHNYTGRCPRQERQRNDELRWLWNSSTALFPSVAIRRSSMDSLSNLHFSRCRVLESLRIAQLSSHHYQLPTFVYTRLGYRDEPMTFLTTKDLIHTIGESAALGAAGFVIWGDLNLTSSRHNCTRVRSLLSHRLGKYITNVTRAAEACSQALCHSNGRCVRRDPYAPHYLHLSSRTHLIRSAGGGAFSVTGGHTRRELSVLSQRFHCHCYHGYSGEWCERLTGGEERPEERPGERTDGRTEERPAGGPEERPGERTDGRTEERPAGGPEERPGERTDGRTEERPAGGPEERPGERPDGRTEERPAGGPEERPGERTDGRTEERPAGGPEERPGERPDGRTEERPDGRTEERLGERTEEGPEERPRERPDGRTEERPGERPEERPEVRTEESPQERPGERPDERPGERPEDRPDERPAGGPEESSDSSAGKATAFLLLLPITLFSFMLENTTPLLDL